MKPKDLLRLSDLDAAAINRLVDGALLLKKDFDQRAQSRPLAGRRICLIVDDTGWRNPSALDLGSSMLGATCTRVSASLDGKEAISDLARYLDNWFDLIAIRTRSLAKLAELAAVSSRPVINLRTRENHPFETLGDLSFVKSILGSIDNLVVAAVAPADNIIHSWAEAAAVMSLHLIQVAPREHWLDRGYYGHGKITQTESMAVLCEADVIITDCWRQGASARVMNKFQITGAHLDCGKPGMMFIPCPPVARGQEVSEDAVSHHACVCFSAKEFLLHAQNAFVLEALR
jgi:ornithine carbamoyltransferase